jgi:soluble lytic murein transglycosylase-like protein
MSRLVALLAIALAAPLAHAELWGYIDEHGKPHVANHRVDERYQLFFKGPTNLDVPPAAPKPSPQSFSGAAAVILERVSGHPNVARFARLIDTSAKQHGLDPALVKAVIAVESAYEPTAVSAKGAIGLMQVIPATAERYGLASDARRSVVQKLMDPATNLSIGTRYLAELIGRFENDLTLALAAYNAGEGAVERYARRVPPYPETQAYVALVQQFHAIYAPPAAPPPKPTRVVVPKPGNR